MVVALILFGPRKLPELGRSIGRSLSEFKRASEDFKRTWEREVELERTEQESRLERAMLPEVRPAEFPGEERQEVVSDIPEEVSVPRGDTPAAVAAEAKPETTRKQDWL